jgi:hypothetical protein
MHVSRYRALVLASAIGLTLVTSATAGTAVPLGTAASFSVLAGSGITNTGPTTVSGDIGTFPTTTIPGLASMTVLGANHAGDAVTQQAKADLVPAYNVAAAEGPAGAIAADLGGRTLTPGVYSAPSALGLTGTVTLDAGGDPNALFVFKVGSAFTSASGSSVALINGAQACNVYWQIGSSATLGTGSSFRGTILALTSITVTTGVTVDGRLLARNGAVTLDTDTITRSACNSTPTTSTPGTTTPGTTTKPGTAPAAPATGTSPGTTKPGSSVAPGTAAPGVVLTPAEKRLVAKKKKAKTKLAASKPKTPTIDHKVAPPKTSTHTFGFTG